MHITSGVYVNDWEDGLIHDFQVWLEKLAPHAPISQYRHNDTGEDNADQMRMDNNGPIFTSNHAGGVLGGLSTGQPVVARVAFKPTSSILIPRETVNEAGEEVELRTKGRHDPCVGIRGVPVVEAMTACVLADAFLRHRAQTGGGVHVPGPSGHG